QITIKNNISELVTAAYFNENPNFPSSFSKSFNTEIKEKDIRKINNNEFWDLNGNEPVNINLKWDSYSEIKNVADNIEDLRIVGWNKEKNQWVDLGNFKTTGDLNEGTITSLSFIPNQYDAITIGSHLSSDGG